MKQPSVYLKMRVLGAIDIVEGRTRHQRIHNVAAMSFLDEQGHSRQFTWRTIQTWFYRYKNHGITGVTPQPRKDKGQVRKLTPEELLEAINAAKPHFHDQRTNKRAIYRFCIEKGSWCKSVGCLVGEGHEGGRQWEWQRCQSLGIDQSPDERLNDPSQADNPSRVHILVTSCTSSEVP